MNDLRSIIKKFCVPVVLAGSMIGCNKNYEEIKVNVKSDRGDYFQLIGDTKNGEQYVIYVHPHLKPLELIKDAISTGTTVKFCTDYTSKSEYTHMGKKAHTITLWSYDIDVVPEKPKPKKTVLEEAIEEFLQR